MPPRDKQPLGRGKKSFKKVDAQRRHFQSSQLRGQISKIKKVKKKKKKKARKKRRKQFSYLIVIRQFSLKKKDLSLKFSFLIKMCFSVFRLFLLYPVLFMTFNS